MCFCLNSSNMYSRDEFLYQKISAGIPALKFDIPPEYKDIDLKEGRNGLLYSPYAPGHSLLSVPFTYLSKNWKNKLFGSKIYTSFVTAVILILITFQISKNFFSIHSAAAFVFSCYYSTMLGVYSKTFFSELSAALFFLLIFFEYKADCNNLNAEKEYKTGKAVKYGLYIAFLILIKTVNILFLPLFGIYYYNLLKKQPRKILICSLVILLAFAAIAAGITGFYNYYRFGDFFESGYMKTHPSGTAHGFITPFHIGFYGLLFSAGKSVFLYCPLLILFFFIRKKLPENFKSPYSFAATIFFFHIILFSKWLYWAGGITVWGPRFLVPAILPMLFCVMFAYNSISLKWKIIFWDLLIIGIMFNIAALIFDYRLFIPCTDWDNELRLYFYPHESPIVRGLQYIMPGAIKNARHDVIFAGILIIVPLTLVYFIAQALLEKAEQIQKE